MARSRATNLPKLSQTSKPPLKLVKKHSPHSIYDIYLNSLAPSGRSGIKSLLNTCARLLDPKFDSTTYPWQTLNFADASKVRAELLSRGYAVATVNLALSAIKGLVKVAFNLGIYSADEMARVHAVKRVRGQVLRKGRSLTVAEVRKLLRAAKGHCCEIRGCRDAALVLLACGSGLRVAELVALEVRDFDVESGSIHIKRGKGRKERKLYLSKRVVKALNLWLERRHLLETRHQPERPLFCRVTKAGVVMPSALSKAGIADILTNLSNRSGVARFTPHDLRRTFITQLLDRGVDINTVRQLAGHANIATTASYDFRGEKELIRATQGLVW